MDGNHRVCAGFMSPFRFRRNNPQGPAYENEAEEVLISAESHWTLGDLGGRMAGIEGHAPRGGHRSIVDKGQDSMMSDRQECGPRARLHPRIAGSGIDRPPRFPAC